VNHARGPFGPVTARASLAAGALLLALPAVIPAGPEQGQDINSTQKKLARDGGGGPDHAKQRDQNLEQQIACTINAERQYAGLDALRVNPGLTDAAQKYARFLAAGDPRQKMPQDATGHPLGGADVGQRATAAGYQWYVIGENVDYCSADQHNPVQYFVQRWINSPTPKANILEPAFMDTGVGVWRTDTGYVYAVQDFGATAQPAPRAGRPDLKITAFSARSPSMTYPFVEGTQGVPGYFFVPIEFTIMNVGKSDAPPFGIGAWSKQQGQAAQRAGFLGYRLDQSVPGKGGGYIVGGNPGRASVLNPQPLLTHDPLPAGGWLKGSSTLAVPVFSQEQGVIWINADEGNTNKPSQKIGIKVP
jgi:uncharacterized protein YkwD